jgi:peptide/nickel transport system substrate-binding protein
LTKALAAALSAVLALLTAPVPAAAAVKNPDTFVYAGIGDAESFDPAWAYDTPSHAVIDNVYEYLLAFKGSGTRTKDLVPMLAAKVPNRADGSISADGRTYRFTIRDGVKFHDGAALTPDDVRYSLLRLMLTDRDGGPSSLLLEPLLGLTSTRKDGRLVPGLWDAASKAVTVDGNAVVVRLKKPFAPILTILASFGAVTERRWCAAHGQWDGEGATVEKSNNPRLEETLPKELVNGTGPFKLARFERNTKEVVLERNDAYWRKPAALKTVVIKVVDEYATRKLMIQAGDADVVYVPLMYFPQMQGLTGVEVIDGLQNLERSMLLAFTFKVDPAGNGNIGSGKLDGEGVPPDFFSDKDVRQAFAHAVDYPGYVRDILRGKGSQSAGMIPPGLLGFKAGPPRYTLDLKKSAEHFKKAWGGQVWDKGFRVSIVFNTGSPQSQTLTQMIKKNVESLNPKFRVDIKQVQWSTYLEQTQARKIPLQLAAWQADYPDPHNFVFPLLHSDGFYPSKQGYKNPELDALIEEAAHTLDEAKRAALYKKIQDIADEDVPSVPIADAPRYRVQRSWVKGFVFMPAFPDMPYSSYYYDLRKAE